MTRGNYDDLGATPWWMETDGPDPAPCRDRFGPDPAQGPIGRGVDLYLRAVAAAVRDGEVVELPHLGRLRLADIGRGVVFEAAGGLTPADEPPYAPVLRLLARACLLLEAQQSAAAERIGDAVVDWLRAAYPAAHGSAWGAALRAARDPAEVGHG